MQAEFRKLKSAPSFKRRFETGATSSLIGGGESESTDELLPRYTSLKDILLFNSSSPNIVDYHNDPNSNNISIRNELVKHAASAYVLSATVINPPNRDEYYHDWIIIPGIWDRLKNCCAGFFSCCRFRVRMPLHDLCGPVFGIVYRVFRRIRNGIYGDSL